jgi:hypothetical protein
VAHRALVQIIEEAEKEIKHQCEITQERMARDSTLIRNAFEREIRSNYKKLHGSAQAEVQVVQTGDLKHHLEKRKEQQRASLMSHAEPAAPSFELKLKSEQAGDSSPNRRGSVGGCIMPEDAIVTVSPNMGMLSTSNELAKARHIGQDVETDLFIQNLVSTVPYASLVEGFISLENTASSGAVGHSQAEQDMLPTGWWDRKRAYTALLHEARSLDQRRVLYELSARELKKKSGQLTEAIDVVRKSAFETGSGLQKMSVEKSEVDAGSMQSLREGRAGVRRFERAIEGNEKASAEASTELGYLEKLLVKRVALEEEEEKARLKQEAEDAARAKVAAKANPNQKKKGKKSPTKKAPPPPPRKKKGEEVRQPIPHPTPPHPTHLPNHAAHSLVVLLGGPQGAPVHDGRRAAREDCRRARSRRRPRKEARVCVPSLGQGRGQGRDR